MADLMDIIKERRSIRNYEDRKVPEALIKQVIEAVRWAPSWTNCQCWEIIVVKNTAIKEKLQSTLPPRGNPALKAMVQAPIVLCVCAKTKTSGYYKGIETTKFGDWFMYDLGIATQNLCLMAHSLGLGTVVVGLYDHNKAKSIVKVPDGFELVTMVPMGFPAKVGSAPRRRKSKDFTHADTF